MKNVLGWCFKNITQRYPGSLLIFAVLLSGISIYWASGLAFNPRMDNLLPQDLPLIKEFNEVIDKTGGSGPLVVVLEQLNPIQAPEVIDKLAKALKKVPGTHFVDSKSPEDFFKNRQLLLMPKPDLLQLETLVGEAIDYARGQFGGFFGEEKLFNPIQLQKLADRFKIFEDINPYHKGKHLENYYIFVKPNGSITDTDFTEQYVRLIEEVIDKTGLEKDNPDLHIKLTGSLMVRLEENQIIQNDLSKSAILAALLASCIILIYTRSFFSIPLIIFPLLLSLSYTFALTRLIIGHLNIISGFLVAILMGLGIDYGIHLYIRFKQELLKGKSIAEAAELVVTQVGRSGLVAMLTTVSVFSILSFSDFPGFSEFGIIATLGILCAFLSYYFIFPAQALFYDKIHWISKPTPRLFTLKISNLYSSTPYFLSAIFLLLMALSFVLLPELKFEYDFQKLKGESPASDYETITTDDFGLAFSPTLILTPKKEDLFEIHTALDEIKDDSGDQTIIGLQYSLNLFSPQEYESKKDVVGRIQKIFHDNTDIIKFSLGNDRYENFKKLVSVEPFDENQMPQNLFKKLRAGDDYLFLLFSPADKNFFRVENIYKLEKEVEALKQKMVEKNIKIAVLNENLIAAKILDWVKEKGPRAMVLAFILVFLILVVDLRSVHLSVITFMPLFTGLALTGALMSVFNIKLNFINIVMLPSIVGIMIDHCIYLIHHILDYSKGSSLKSLQETGSAIILSALTSLAGYVSLNIAHHAGVRSIASVVGIGIITCTVCALFMLPALFELRKHNFPFVLSRKR
ncbi:MAG: MMPL family transporter [Nitrospinaceae bacterium]|nr:MMPL family transporter [Nitrospinaceae bacterium]